MVFTKLVHKYGVPADATNGLWLSRVVFHAHGCFLDKHCFDAWSGEIISLFIVCRRSLEFCLEEELTLAKAGQSERVRERERESELTLEQSHCLLALQPYVLLSASKAKLHSLTRLGEIVCVRCTFLSVRNSILPVGGVCISAGRCYLFQIRAVELS